MQLIGKVQYIFWDPRWLALGLEKKSPTSLKWPPIVAPCIRGLSHNDASYWSIDFRFGESQRKKESGQNFKMFLALKKKRKIPSGAWQTVKTIPRSEFESKNPCSGSRMYENCWVGGREPGTAHQMTRLPHHAANFPPEKNPISSHRLPGYPTPLVRGSKLQCPPTICGFIETDGRFYGVPNFFPVSLSPRSRGSSEYMDRVKECFGFDQLVGTTTSPS